MGWVARGGGNVDTAPVSARECFCGCGEKVKRRHVPYNVLGAEMKVELGAWAQVRYGFRQADREFGLEEFFKEGLSLEEGLREFVHTGDQPASLDLTRAGQWNQFSRKERGKFDALVDEAAAEVEAGEGMPESSEEPGADEELDPVSEKLANELGLSVGGGRSSWLFWVGTSLIDTGMWMFRQMENVCWDDRRPVFPDMAQHVQNPWATETATKFIAAAYPALASRLCGLGEDRWEGWGIDEWRRLDKDLHDEVFSALIGAWKLPEEQVAFITDVAAKGFSSKDRGEREFMAYPRFEAAVVEQAYLLPTGGVAANPPAWDEYVNPSGDVHFSWHGGLCEYFRKLKYYTEDIIYRDADGSPLEQYVGTKPIVPAPVEASPEEPDDDGEAEEGLVPEVMLAQLSERMAEPISDDLSVLMTAFLAGDVEGWDALTDAGRSLLLTMAVAGYCTRSITIENVESATDEAPFTASLIQYNAEENDAPLYMAAAWEAEGHAGLESRPVDHPLTRSVWLTVPGVVEVEAFSDLAQVSIRQVVAWFLEEVPSFDDELGDDEMLLCSWLFGYFLRAGEQFSTTGGSFYEGAEAYLDD